MTNKEHISVILASQSPSRRQLLKEAGIIPLISVSYVDEDEVLQRYAQLQNCEVEDIPTSAKVTLLAAAKAYEIEAQYWERYNTIHQACGEVWIENKGSDDNNSPAFQLLTTIESYKNTHKGLMDQKDGPLIIGSDSLFEVDGVALGKPHTPQKAQEQLEKRSGKTGIHYTGHTLINLGSRKSIDTNDSARGINSMNNHPWYDDKYFYRINPQMTKDLQSMEEELLRKSSQAALSCAFSSSNTRPHEASAVSRASIHFTQYSSAEMEVYIQSGEPLQVAGAFTLDGRGGAFIDSIEGDPHGIIGLSIPLVRHLARDLGIFWTDLWNSAQLPNTLSAARCESGIVSTNDVDVPIEVSNAKKKTENYFQAGDGWQQCEQGHVHWGTRGAAGLLVVRADENNTISDMILQHRSQWTAQGGTWGIPGGAVGDGENIFDTALRESWEEAAIPPSDIDIKAVVIEDHGHWSYSTVIAQEKKGKNIIPRAQDSESSEVKWVSVADLPQLPLMSAFKRSYSSLINIAEKNLVATTNK